MKRYRYVYPGLRKFDLDQFVGNGKVLVNMDEPIRGVFTFDLLRPEFCRELLDEAEAYQTWAEANGVELSRPNSMNNYGLLLNDIGMRDWLTAVMRKFVAPLSSLYYDEIGPLRSHYGFLVDYEVGKQRSLAEHYDTSDVTLNVCLGRPRFVGGEVVFNTKFGKIAIPHKIGRAIVHKGKLLHRATPIQSGARSNLIVWYSTKKARK